MLKKVPVAKNRVFCLMRSYWFQLLSFELTWSQNAPARAVSLQRSIGKYKVELTFNVSVVYGRVPEAMASDRDVVADGRGVEHVGAEELVAEESGRVVRGHGPCWVGVAAGGDEGGKGSDGGEDGSEEVHLDGGDGCWIRGISDFLISSKKQDVWERF
jgi:hypothetical protein